VHADRRRPDTTLPAATGGDPGVHQLRDQIAQLTGGYTALPVGLTVQLAYRYR